MPCISRVMVMDKAYEPLGTEIKAALERDYYSTQLAK